MKEFLDLDPAVGFAVNVQLLLVELVQLSHLARFQMHSLPEGLRLWFVEVSFELSFTQNFIISSISHEHGPQLLRSFFSSDF